MGLWQYETNHIQHHRDFRSCDNSRIDRNITNKRNKMKNTEYIPLRIDAVTLSWLKRHAEDSNSDVSKICRKAIREYRDRNLCKHEYKVSASSGSLVTVGNCIHCGCDPTPIVKSSQIV